jgi:hypothetical protein
VALRLLDRTLDLGLFASTVACRGFINLVAFVRETPEHTFWAVLVASAIMTTPHVTSLDLFNGNLLSLG